MWQVRKYRGNDVKHSLRPKPKTLVIVRASKLPVIFFATRNTYSPFDSVKLLLCVHIADFVSEYNGEKRGLRAWSVKSNGNWDGSSSMNSWAMRGWSVGAVESHGRH